MSDYPKYRNNVCSKSCIYLNYSNHKNTTIPIWELKCKCYHHKNNKILMIN